MPRTEAQIAASRANGAKSRGPSPAGQAVSRRNALKHGLRARMVLPEPMAREAAEEEAGFIEALRPANAYERGLVATMARAAVQGRHAGAAVVADADCRVRHAVDDWDADRDAEVEHWFGLLHDDPAEATRQLERTAEGCDRLSDTLSALLDRAVDDAAWSDDDTATAAALLGLDGASADDARLAVLEHAEGEVDRLRDLAEENWGRYDEADRASAPDRARCSLAREAVRLRGYEQAASRTFLRALTLLCQSRERGIPDPPAPEPQPEATATIEPEPAPAAATNEPKPLAPAAVAEPSDRPDEPRFAPPGVVPGASPPPIAPSR